MKKNIEMIETIQLTFQFSYEKYIYRKGIVNLENTCIAKVVRNQNNRDKIHNNLCLKDSLYGEKVIVWATLKSSWVLRPFFFENKDGDTQAVNQD
jgi:hypothetical protein